MSEISISVSKYVEIDTEVDMEDVLDSCSRDELRELIEKAQARLYKTKASTVPEISEGPFAPERIVESAYLAARDMRECPAPLRDLLWHVHGRAI
jgi:hypothetical protein